MIPIQKSINFDHKSTFTIPVKWGKKVYIEEGSTVKIRVHNNYIFIEQSYKSTVDVISTVSRRGSIYIPKEIRNYFEQKGMTRFYIYIDTIKHAIIMKPQL